MPVAWRARALKYVPDPLRASRNPSRFKSLIARRTVIRETPNFRISMLSLGILPSALYLPSNMSCRSAVYTFWCFGVVLPMPEIISKTPPSSYNSFLPE